MPEHCAPAPAPEHVRHLHAPLSPLAAGLPPPPDRSPTVAEALSLKPDARSTSQRASATSSRPSSCAWCCPSRLLPPQRPPLRRMSATCSARRVSARRVSGERPMDTGCRAPHEGDQTHRSLARDTGCRAPHRRKGPEIHNVCVKLIACRQCEAEALHRHAAPGIVPPALLTSRWP
jgi:hypothetical protein